MLAILKELDQIEGAFFIPVNAHPLKKVNEPLPKEIIGSESGYPNSESLNQGNKGDSMSYSEHYAKWASSQYGKKPNSDGFNDFGDYRRGNSDTSKY